MATVRLNRICKRFGDVTAVRDVSLTVEDGEFVTFVGPSGCGKTTTLRMVAGLEAAGGGELWIGDRLANDIHPADRDVAMVFQSYALYPHMTVFENIAYGLKLRKFDRAEIEARVADAAALLKLDGLMARRPAQLSGGQRQRVALGRALVRRPAVFLMDEPLSNLDAQLRVGMRTELLRLHARLGITTIYVTHDQIEAMTLANRVVVMNEGRVEQIGPPLALYQRPLTLFVARFVGTPPMNLIDGGIATNAGGFRFSSESITFDLASISLRGRGRAVAGLRPQHLHAVPVASKPPAPKVRLGAATVDVVEHYGPESFATCSVADTTLTATVDPDLRITAGAVVELWADPAQVLLFDAASGLRLDSASFAEHLVATGGCNGANEGI